MKETNGARSVVQEKEKERGRQQKKKTSQKTYNSELLYNMKEKAWRNQREFTEGGGAFVVGRVASAGFGSAVGGA